MKLAALEDCTACGACVNVCPKQCIKYSKNLSGVIYPSIIDSDCISCGLCQKKCPALSPVEFNNVKRSYAAWSSNEEERKTSASGGIAAELYKNAISKGFKIVGAKMNSDFSVDLVCGDKLSDIRDFKNSKYVFSSTGTIIKQIKDLIKNGESVLVIALPCQIAAIKKFCKDSDRLFLVDVICHGTTPFEYLKQHIKKIEKEFGETAVTMSHRDHNKDTHTFTFTLYNSKGENFYSKRTKDGDTYQFGFHRSISYRENCYHCKYAQEKRISDITLGDYSGLGRMAECAYSNKNVSCVLVNTDKGQTLIDDVIANKSIVAEERPLREPIEGNSQLRRPSPKTKWRYLFEQYIKESDGDFEMAISKVYKKYSIQEKFNMLLIYPRILVSKILRTFIKK